MHDLTPDESRYQWAAGLVRSFGLRRGLTLFVDAYLGIPDAHHGPSPLRWLYVAAVATVPARALNVVALVLCAAAAWWLGGPLAAGIALLSPLAHVLARRQLQDLPVAALTLAAIGCAVHGHPVGLAVALWALLSVKEAALLAFPGVTSAALLAGHADVLMAMPVAIAAWATSISLLLGRRALAVSRRARRGHDHDYGRQHQRGAPQRLLVDLVALSPGPVLFAALGAGAQPELAAAAALLLAAHAASPVRNVRTVLAVDMLARVLVAAAPWPLLLVVVGLDAWTLRTARLRLVRDPVTGALTWALDMTP